MKYYSEVLNKKFDTVEELNEAEALFEQSKTEKEETLHKLTKEKETEESLVKSLKQDAADLYKEWSTESSQLRENYTQKLRNVNEALLKAEEKLKEINNQIRTNKENGEEKLAHIDVDRLISSFIKNLF